MKKVLVFSLIVVAALSSFGNNKDSVIYYQLPDSVKASSFLADISVGTINARKEVFAGIKTDVVKLLFESDKKAKEIVFEFPTDAVVISSGIGIDGSEKGELSWNYNWEENISYKFLIATAGDSAGNFSLYSGYIFLPKENKWKLIGTAKIVDRWNTIQQPAFFYTKGREQNLSVTADQAWCQRQNGSWKNMLQKDIAPPVVNLYSHVDSLQQLALEKNQLKLLQSTSLAVDRYYGESNGVYYSILKEGTGKQVSVNDTVTVFYKGYIYDDPKKVFDETKDKPATFPLKRLIMGWQIGVPLCKVGGKIKLIIPSNLAYSIRTRGAKIPPNSILVFEIEVVDAKLPQ